MSSRSENTYRLIRDMILDGRLPKGLPVQEQALSRRLKVSRTPVREAVGRLVAEGLINREPGSVPTVTQIFIDDFMEILHVRRLLEIEAASLAASRPDHEKIAKLSMAIDSLLGDPEPKEETHIQIDDDIHESIAIMSGSRLLVTMIRDLRLKTRMFGMKRIPERFRPGCHEHKALLAAIDRGDSRASQDLMRTHLDGVRTSIMSTLERLF